MTSDLFCCAKMLHICALSGEELATFSADEVEGSLVGGFSERGFWGNLGPY